MYVHVFAFLTCSLHVFVSISYSLSLSLTLADLIMLGLATHEPYFTILREEFKPNQPRPCEICNQYGMSCLLWDRYPFYIEKSVLY